MINVKLAKLSQSWKSCFWCSFLVLQCFFQFCCFAMFFAVLLFCNVFLQFCYFFCSFVVLQCFVFFGNFSEHCSIPFHSTHRDNIVITQFNSKFFCSLYRNNIVIAQFNPIIFSTFPTVITVSWQPPPYKRFMLDLVTCPKHLVSAT